VQKYQDVILNTLLAPVAGASVLVRPTGSVSTSTIYAASTGTAVAANPITADSNGRFSFYGANGRYDLVVSGSFIATTTYTDIMLEDVPLSNLSELSTASSARNNLGLGSAAVISTSSFLQTANNLSDIPVAATARASLGLIIGTNVQAFDSANVVSTSTNTFTKAQRGAVVALASTGQIAPDMNAGNNFSLSMTVNTTMAAGTNVVAGQLGRIVITQNSTAKTLAFNTFWKFPGGTTGTLSTATAAGTTDVLEYYVMTTTSAECVMRNGLA